MDSHCWTKDLRIKKGVPASGELNKSIAALESAILSLVNRQMVAEPNLKSKEVKDKLENYLNRKRRVKEILVKEPKSLYDFFEQFIKESRSTKTAGTVKTYLRTLGALKSFKPKLRFEDINMDFYYAFIDHMQKVYGMRENTIGLHIKNLKAVLNEAKFRGLNSNLDYKQRKFKVVFQEADAIYLRLDEIKRIRELDLSAKPGMEKVRDLFLIGCFTGLRFSDFSQIKKANFQTIEENQFISLRTIKTSSRVVIPLNQTIIEILEKYEGNIPKPDSNQAMNRTLKHIGKLAGIEETVIIRENRKGISYKRSLHKYELISSHIARRSFATNAFSSDIHTIAIMRITGHTNEKAFMQYIKVSEQENALLLADHSFFK
ncbi:MAG: site-specific integrase [Bacteroidales bacterium]|nr:site-specific integrase [Bacteroidales bacterium]